MRIYKAKSQKVGFSKFYKNLKPNKKILIKVGAAIFLGGIFFAPIGLFRINSKYAKLLGQTIYSVAGKIGPEYSYLAKDIFLLGDNLFGLSYRYLGSLSNKQEKLEINLNANNYKKILNFVKHFQ